MAYRGAGFGGGHQRDQRRARESDFSPIGEGEEAETEEWSNGYLLFVAWKRGREIEEMDGQKQKQTGGDYVKTGFCLGRRIARVRCPRDE